MRTLTDLLNNEHIVLLDSAMGTELQKRECDITGPLWSARAITECPDTIRLIHIDNIDNGADIITTNTFRTQKRTFEKAGFHFEELDYAETAAELTKLAVDIAEDAVMIANENVLIAGCISPIEDCYKPGLVPDTDILCAEHYEHIKNLVDAEVSFLLAETMMNIQEISAVLNQVHKFDIEYAISLLCKNEFELFSGEPLTEAMSIIEKFSPAAVMINCIHPSKAENIIRVLKKMTDRPLGVYCNIGDPNFKEGDKMEKTVTPKQYLGFAKKWKELGVRIIGGCCGTSPEYIYLLNSLRG